MSTLVPARETHQQVDGAAHPVLLVVVVDDGPVLEQQLKQLAHNLHKQDALLADGRVAVALRVNTETQTGCPALGW